MSLNLTLTFQNLIFKEPLFRYRAAGEKNMNILVLGSERNSAVLADLMLEAGQMKDCLVDIHVLIENAENFKDSYLGSRPAFSRFVDVNGTAATDESYGKLCFHEFGKGLSLEEKLAEVCSEVGNERIHYYVVAFDDYGLNRTYAETIRKSIESRTPSEKCLIAYVSEKSSDEGGLKAIGAGEITSFEDIDPELERMAFNAHLAWYDSIEGNIQKLYRDFVENQYAYQSSISIALSLKYKLSAFGIDIDSCGYDRAAELFHEMLNGNEAGDKSAVYSIAALEHRRWILEKAADGWQAPGEGVPENMNAFFEEAIKRGTVRDNEKKLHPCMVRSSDRVSLTKSEYYKELRHWNNRVDREAELDDLDRMSLILHRKMRSKAQGLNDRMTAGILPEISELKSLTDNSDKNRTAFNALYLCTEYILGGNRDYSLKFEKYSKAFTGSMEDEGKREKAGECLKKLGCILFPVIENNLYRDYKENDEILVRKIPFILTYKRNIKLAAAFAVTHSLTAINDIIFLNVASATVIKPEEITYVLYVCPGFNLEVFKRMLTAVCRYLGNKEINSKINFIVVGNRQYKNKIDAVINTIKSTDTDGTGIGCTVAVATEDSEYPELVSKAILDSGAEIYDASAYIFDSNIIDAETLMKIRQAMPCFEYESSNKKFINLNGCRYLKYIDDRSYLGIEEMFGLLSAGNVSYNYPPAGVDYNLLWQIYSGMIRNKDAQGGWQNNFKKAVSEWNKLCDALCEYSRRNFEDRNGNFIKPELTDRIVEINELKNYIVARNSQEMQKVLNVLEDICAHNGNGKFVDPVYEGGLLKAFSYASAGVEKVLTKAGEIFEIHIFMELLNSHDYDEVATGYEFHWNDESITNELDLVVTKGFQTAIVECKAKRLVDQDYYFKLNSLVDMFGINVKKVLITTAEDENWNSNGVQFKRGDLMDTITISQTNELLNIAKTFKERVF